MTSPRNESPINEIRKTPENFLGANSNLVNLDALVSTKSSSGIHLYLLFIYFLLFFSFISKTTSNEM
jgi:hypothetical protein